MASVSRSVSSAVPEPITATGSSAHRRVRYSVITSSGLVTTSATRGSPPASTAVATVVHHLDVLVQHVEPALARRRVVAGRDDEDVLVLDLVEAAAAHLDPRQQRPGVHEVEGEAVRGAAVAAVDGHPAREPAHDDRRRGRDTDTTGADDADSQTRHAPPFVAVPVAAP